MPAGAGMARAFPVDAPLPAESAFCRDGRRQNSQTDTSLAKAKFPPDAGYGHCPRFLLLTQFVFILFFQGIVNRFRGVARWTCC
jgi:hypothetical protein